MVNVVPKNICIQKSCHIVGSESITYLGNVHIGRHIEIMAEGGITIGNNVVISFHCVLWSIDHHYDAEQLPYGFARIKKPIIINDISAYDYCRGSALQALSYTLIEGYITREEILSFYRELFS